MEFGASQSYGSRSYLEDFHVVVPSLLKKEKVGFAGVYDGHGGTSVAEYCAANMHLEVAKLMEQGHSDHDALHLAFLQIDGQLRSEEEAKSKPECAASADDDDEDEEVEAGSTAVVALIRDDRACRGTYRIVVANVGDSRAILSKAGVAIDLARAHEPEVADERARIEAAGGGVVFLPNGCISSGDSSLSMSRSIGDFDFKKNKSVAADKQAVVAVPEIQEEEVEGGDEDFLVLSSDGIWMESQDVVDYVCQNMKKKEENDESMRLDSICEDLIKKNDANDNSTVIIIKFK